MEGGVGRKRSRVSEQVEVIPASTNYRPGPFKGEGRRGRRRFIEGVYAWYVCIHS
jgi:hypothetical protein